MKKTLNRALALILVCAIFGACTVGVGAQSPRALQQIDTDMPGTLMDDGSSQIYYEQTDLYNLSIVVSPSEDFVEFLYLDKLDDNKLYSTNESYDMVRGNLNAPRGSTVPWSTLKEHYVATKSELSATHPFSDAVERSSATADFFEQLAPRFGSQYQNKHVASYAAGINFPVGVTVKENLSFAANKVGVAVVLASGSTLGGVITTVLGLFISNPLIMGLGVLCGIVGPTASSIISATTNVQPYSVTVTQMRFGVIDLQPNVSYYEASRAYTYPGFENTASGNTERAYLDLSTTNQIVESFPSESVFFSAFQIASRAYDNYVAAN